MAQVGSIPPPLDEVSDDAARSLWATELSRSPLPVALSVRPKGLGPTAGRCLNRASGSQAVSSGRGFRACRQTGRGADLRLAPYGHRLAAEALSEALTTLEPPGKPQPASLPRRSETWLGNVPG